MVLILKRQQPVVYRRGTVDDELEIIFKKIIRK